MVWWLWHESEEFNKDSWNEINHLDIHYCWKLSLFLRKKNTFIWPGHTELIESYSEDLFICYKKGSFNLMLFLTTVFNIGDNKLCFLSTKSEWFLKDHETLKTEVMTAENDTFKCKTIILISFYNITVFTVFIYFWSHKFCLGAHKRLLLKTWKTNTHK